MANNSPVFCIVCGIPRQFHAAELRNYFATLIDAKVFRRFHFRHRPETDTFASRLFAAVSNEERDDYLKLHKKTDLCCIISLTEVGVTYLRRMYHGKHWTDADGKALPEICLIYSLTLCKVSDPVPELHPPVGLPNGNVGTPICTLLEQIRLCVLPARVVGNLGVQFTKPRGGRLYSNVPFDYAASESEPCEDLSQERVNHLESDNKDAELENKLQWMDMDDVRTGNGHAVLSDADYQLEEAINSEARTSHSKHDKLASTAKSNSKSKRFRSDTESEEGSTDSESSSSDEEEWDRHEALHDDCGTQERRNQTLFEKDLDVTWEKGGPGIVRYTDAQHWYEIDAADPEERYADDWDMLPARPGADLTRDQRDLLSIRASQRWTAAGIVDEALFGVTAPRQTNRRRQKRKIRQSVSTRDSKYVGAFEQHTRGVGRRVLERFGWVDGTGIGAKRSGMLEPVAIELERQYKPKRRTSRYVQPARFGLGYRELALPSGQNQQVVSSASASNVSTGRAPAQVSIKGQRQVKHEYNELARISTVYDEPDPIDSLYLRQDPQNVLKRRDRLNAAGEIMPLETMWTTMPHAQQT